MASHAGLAAYPSLRHDYGRLVEKGEISRDPVQEALTLRFDRVIAELGASNAAAKTNALGWLFARKKAPSAVRGLYVYGGVGRGKTMLMDMFFRLAPLKQKRRAHFNEFMADVHDRIGLHRAALKAGTVKGDDPIPPVAAAIAAESRLLCFDEFTVTDIADAMILSRLFTALFSNGVTLVATSNVAPDDLYRDGLNRGLFLPFIQTLKDNVDVVAVDIPTDYRMLKLSHLPVYVTPLGPATDGQMDEAWAAATEGRSEAPVKLEVMGRHVNVPRASGKAARFTFADLCDAPLGARDYLAIAERFDTIFIDHIPVMDQTRRNASKRFILLIDTLYDRHIRLVASAEASPDRLYAGREGVTEAFEFARTASRLNEMQSREWVEGAGA
ncbi:cell division protein ZapE [Mesorhizobium sp. J428]|uniref:cell division protein ZapE n=1 Tax=Mesorhizobium sp. J428 TaxID=2898440 RepID=UPI0021507817|nr:cell division protein ZapE [Mesorhizobium sp. J428]MCR5857132.1 cell division protein ZapE [Mesorhizobium sp. J428]